MKDEPENGSCIMMRENREEIIHKDAVFAEKLFPVMIILTIFTISFLILLILSELVLIGVFILLFYGSVNILMIYRYYFQLQFSTIFENDRIILHSKKKDIVVNIQDIISIRELRYLTIETEQKKYRITATNGQNRNDILLAFIKRNVKVYDIKGNLINGDDEELKRRKDLLKRFVSNEQYKFYLLSKKVTYSSLPIIFIPILTYLIISRINYDLVDYSLLLFLVIMTIIGVIVYLTGLQMIYYTLNEKNRKKWIDRKKRKLDS